MNANKRLATNTIILYGKLVITTLIGLLTSRYVLNALGASDYGLYSVVGGIVSFMNVIGASMVATSYRFLAVELGKGENGNLQRIYSTVSLVHFVIAILLMIIGETIGLYYVDNFLNVDACKLSDARFVLHISLLTTSATVINVPAHGLTIAQEKFMFTSVVGIIHSILKLGLVLLMMMYAGNRLRLFALIMLFLTVFSVILYQWYCHKLWHDVVRLSINKQKEDYKAILGFTGWSTFGAVASMGNNQGAAMIINYFFGTILNAAFGIASQVNQYANVFIKSISQAAVPQIMKSYGEGNNERSTTLIYIISRLSSLALLLIFVPLIVYTEDILVIWLKEPPQYSVPFVRFLLIDTYIAVMGAGFDAGIQSTGNIKNNELGFCIMYLIQLPMIAVFYYFGAPPYVNVILLCFGTFAIKIYQMFLLKRMTSFDIKAYLNTTVLPVVLSTLFAILPILLAKMFFSNHIFVWIVVSMLWTLIIAILCGLRKNEKLKIKMVINQKFHV